MSLLLSFVILFRNIFSKTMKNFKAKIGLYGNAFKAIEYAKRELNMA